MQIEPGGAFIVLFVVLLTIWLKKKLCYSVLFHKERRASWTTE